MTAGTERVDLSKVPLAHFFKAVPMLIKSWFLKRELSEFLCGRCNLMLSTDPEKRKERYRDDGEMQCNQCLIDFKRNEVARIEHMLTNQRAAALCMFDPALTLPAGPEPITE